MIDPDEFQDHRNYELIEHEPDPTRRLEEVEDELDSMIDIDVISSSLGTDATGVYLDITIDGGFPVEEIEEIAQQYGCGVVDREYNGDTADVEIRVE